MDVMDKLHDGSIYDPGDEEVMKVQNECLDRLHRFNQLSPTEYEKQAQMLREMFAEIGEGCYITPPFYANWGGHHIHFGKKIYCNFGVTFVDDTHIYVGDYTEFGPNVTVATAGHPVLPELRADKALQFNMPVHIGKNCWIGAGAIILPGVTIGENTVIGAGSIVTKDIPADVVAAGNPCRVLRPISERDREFYYKDRKIDPGLLQ